LNIIDTLIQPDYAFLFDAYNATGGFKDGRYIVKRPRETMANYEVRQKLSYYLNYVKPVVDSHVNPIFRTEAVRDWDGRKEETDKLFSLFFNNIDTVGTTLPKFMKSTAAEAKLYGSALVVVDNVKDQPTTMADAIAARACPYAYVVLPQDVTDFKVNKAGVLTEITYSVAGDGSGSGGDQKEVWTWTATTWKCSAAGETGNKEGTHNLKRVPVIPLLGAKAKPGKIKPLSEFWGIAKTNARIFNLCSEIDELITKQAFSIFTYPMGANSSKETIKEMLVGTENVVGYDGTCSNAPGFATPDAMPLEQLQSYLDRLIGEIYRMAQQSHVTGVETKASGKAKQWDFESSNQTLSDFAHNIESTEKAIVELYELWASAKVGYISEYPNDFGIIDIAAALDEVTKALDLKIGGRFNLEVKKKAVKVFLNTIKEKDFDLVIADLEKTAQNEAYSQDNDPMSAIVTLLEAVAAEKVSPEAAAQLMQSFYGMTEDAAKKLLEAQSTIIGVAAEKQLAADQAAAEAAAQAKEVQNDKTIPKDEKAPANVGA